MKYVFIAILFALISCKKKEEMCVPKVFEHTTVQNYIENDSSSIFFGKNTVKFTLISKTIEQCSSGGYSGKVYCESNEFSIENLTDKQVSVTVIEGIFNSGTIIALPMSKGDKNISILPYAMSCKNFSQFETKVKYN